MKNFVAYSDDRTFLQYPSVDDSYVESRPQDATVPYLPISSSHAHGSCLPAAFPSNSVLEGPVHL